VTKATPQDQKRLLDLQALDTRLDQLAHKRSALAAHARIAELDARLADLDTAVAASRTAVGDIRREVTKAEADVQQVRDRAARDQQRLDSGQGTAKDLQALTSELASLARRQSELEEVERVRRQEEEHIHRVPWGEREEVRQIFQGKGFSGELLEQIVSVITSSKDLWVDTMLTEEHGLSLAGRSPLRAGLATFVAFIAVGLLPLLPFLVISEATGQAFGVSLLLTALAFAGVGLLKGRLLQRSMLRSGLETLLVGGIAAALAYGAGYVLRQMYDTGSAQLIG